MISYSYVNGKITTTSKAAITVTDIGLQRGYSVFDYICTFNGKLFHFSDHYERFIRSAAELHLSPPLSCKEAEEIGIQLIEKSELNKPALRLILTGGYSDSNAGIGNPNLIIIAEELPYYPEEAFSNGAKLITINFQRELPRVKTTNYLNTFRLNNLKKEKGALDILYYSEHGVTECPRDNFFIFKRDKIITPKDFILLGITRKIVLNLAKEHYSIEERRIDPEELNEADEAFVTSTTKNIIPIVRIDDAVIGNGKIGGGTKNIMNLFDTYTQNYSL